MNETSVMPWVWPVASAFAAFCAGFIWGRISAMRSSSAMWQELREARDRIRRDNAILHARIEARRKEVQETALTPKRVPPPPPGRDNTLSGRKPPQR